MSGFMNKIFGNIHKKEHKKIESNVGFISKIPEDVLYGEDPGTVPQEDTKNQLENDIK